MPIAVIMPKLGLTMDEGTVKCWLKKEGEAVVEGEPLLEVLTDKASVVVESPATGTLARILHGEEATVPIVTEIGIICLPGETFSPAEASGQAVRESTPGPVLAQKSSPPGASAPVKAEGYVAASPLARRLAAELGVDLLTIAGSGPGGRIVEDDIRQAAARGAAEEAAERPRPLVGLAKVVAQRMAASAATAAHYTLTTEADMSACLRRRERFAREGRSVSHTALVVKAVALGLVKFPQMNVTFSEAGLITHRAVNISIAVDVPEGLVAPVIKSADTLGLAAIQAELERLSEAARAGRLSPEDLGGGCFTVSNLGMFGIDGFTMIINQPESAILGMGRIVKKPVVAGDEIGVRPMMTLSLTSDHRVINGAPAARFLAAVREILAQGELD